MCNRLGELGELEATDHFTQGLEDPFGIGRVGSRSMRLGSRLFFGGGADIHGRGNYLSHSNVHS